MTLLDPCIVSGEVEVPGRLVLVAEIVDGVMAVLLEAGLIAHGLILSQPNLVGG